VAKFIGAIVVFALLLANIAATIRVLRFEGSTRGQKFAQTLVVWLLPILGAGLVFALTHDEPLRGGAGDNGGIYADGAAGSGLMDHNSYSSDIGGGDASSGGGDGGGH